MIRPTLLFFFGIASATSATAGEEARLWPALQPVVDVIGSPRPGDARPPSPQPLPPPQAAPDPARPALPAVPGVQPPAPLGSCNDGGCVDTNGNRYNATGDGNRFIDRNGKMCIASGKFITCQ